MILHSGEIPPNLLSIFHYTLSPTKLQLEIAKEGDYFPAARLFAVIPVKIRAIPAKPAADGIASPPRTACCGSCLPDAAKKE